MPTARFAAGLLALTIGALALGAAPATAAKSPITITRVYVNSPGDDLPASNAKINAEHTVIKNTGRATVSLTGWTLRDKSNHVYTFGSFNLGAGKSVTVHNGRGTNSATKRFWRSTYYIWNNSGGDSAVLRNKSGAVIDSCAWGTVASSVSC